MNHSKSIAVTGLVLASLAGATAQANPFAATSLSHGYQLVAAEAACGASTDSKDAVKTDGAKKDHEGKCGEGKCGGDKKKAAAATTDKAAEGKCGEGKCGEGKCGENMGKADAKATDAKTKEAKCGAEHKKASEGSCGGAM